MNKEAVFILNSPFQCICALEAISHFSIKSPCFVVLNDIYSRDMIIPLIQGNGEIVYMNHTSEGIKSLIKSVRKLDIKTNKVFVGDYFSYMQFVMAVLFSRSRALVYYLDDGNSTLEIFPPISRPRSSSVGEKYGYIAFGLLGLLKRVRTNFYTIFNIPNKYGAIEKNSFDYLKSVMPETPHGVFLIGTNAVALNPKRDYSEILNEVVCNLKERFPYSEIYYCPHRRDPNNYIQLFSTLGVKMFDTQISVEVDFQKRKIFPACIAGFGSTALLTLKLMLPKVTSISFHVELLDKQLEESYSYIEDYYKKNDIEVVGI